MTNTTRETPRRFANWLAAFDYCREVNRPVVVIVEATGSRPAQTWQLWPDGFARLLKMADDRAN